MGFGLRFDPVGLRQVIIAPHPKLFTNSFPQILKRASTGGILIFMRFESSFLSAYTGYPKCLQCMNFCFHLVIDEMSRKPDLTPFSECFISAIKSKVAMI